MEFLYYIIFFYGNLILDEILMLSGKIYIPLAKLGLCRHLDIQINLIPSD